jgi:alkanesulfonate monooxygenase SsuD/methylene tetrahydromethanopterin reductase-like flavin-dependent oxidoreductase (luciferase family)
MLKPYGEGKKMEVTLSLPDTTYEQIRRAAEKVKRSIDDVLVEAVIAVAPVFDRAPKKMRSALAQLAYLNDAALWQAARSTMTVEQRDSLQTLHYQQQRRTLTAKERDEEQELLALYLDTILVRAQAAVLLKQRGYEVSDPKQFEPLS